MNQGTNLPDIVHRLRRRPAQLVVPPTDVPALGPDTIAQRIGAPNVPAPEATPWALVAPEAPDEPAIAIAGFPPLPPVSRPVDAPAPPTAPAPNQRARSPDSPARTPPTGLAPERRRRMIRDTGFVLIAIAVVGLVSLALWSNGRPDETRAAAVAVSSTASPIALAAQATASPTPVPTPKATAKPKPKPTHRTSVKITAATRPPTPRPTPKPTRRPTPKPTAAPAPTAVIDVSASCADPDVAITFDASASSHATAWHWDFDGGSADTKVANHSYAADGTYTVILTVTGPGGTDFASKVINVPC